jgi:formylglycine-generating enzyme required for sulfatase activity
MKLLRIEPGKFLMGSPSNEAYRGNDEQQHEVEITRGFWLGADPVTVGQFRAFVKATGYRTQAEREGGAYRYVGSEWKQDPRINWQNPGFQQDDSHPIVCVSWNDAQEFCAWPTKTNSGHLYRLPTDAEWEYACRAGAAESFPFHVGQPSHSLSSTQANFNGDFPYGGTAKGPYLKRTTPVRSYKPNAWGLFDMHGNVWEWCQDWYGADYYGQSPRQDPPGPSEGSIRVIRGGSWKDDGQYCRSAFRFWNEPADRSGALGFRVALVLSGGS